MKTNIYILFFFSILPLVSLLSQTDDTLSNYFYKKGITAVNKKDFEAAKDFFNKSIDEEDNAPAEYELAKIYRVDTSHYTWNLSRQHIKNAIKLDPDNPKYHLFYGLLAEDLYHYSWLEFETIDDAIREYKKTLELDSTNITAAKKLLAIESKNFLEFNNSVNVGGDDDNYWLQHFQKDISVPYQKYIQLGKVQTRQYYENMMPTGNLSYSQFAEESFKTAESASIIATKYDSLNSKPYLTLANIYEDNNEPGKGIPYLQKLARIFPGNMNAHLYLGLLFYRISNMDSAYAEYQKAIALMDSSGRADFVYNSVKVLLEPYLKDKLNTLDQSTLKQFINLFWKERDPLNLTPYNERLLEHYTRVAYSNLRFSVPELNLIGWKTDRGKVVIRYGIPPHITRIRPAVVVRNGLVRTNPETEVWKYPDKTFSFIDQFRNGEYVFGIPGQSQYWDDTQKSQKDLLVTKPEDYKPKFDGPAFLVPNTPYQFKDIFSSDQTDLFIGYGIKAKENLKADKNYKYKHTAGIFLFDNYFNNAGENKINVDFLNRNNKIDIPDSCLLFINTEELTAPPGEFNLAFEIIRNKDKGAASYHGKFNLRSFDSTSLEMSDIVLASDIETGSKIKGRINRKGYSILPNPTDIFSARQNLFIYYEVYNLKKDDAGLTDFQQTIILKKKGEEGISIGKIVGSVLKFVGVEKGEQEVSLTSRYQTKDTDSPVYLRLDMEDYDPGSYILTVKIKDNVTGKETEQSAELFWR